MRTWLAALAALAIGAIFAGFLYALTAPYIFTTSAPTPMLSSNAIGWQSWSRTDGTHHAAQVLVPDEYDRAVPRAARASRTDGQ